MRSSALTAQILQQRARVRRHTHVRVKRKPLQARAPRLRSVHHRGRRAEPAHGMPRPRPAGHAALDRGRGVIGQQRELGHRIARGRILLGPPTPSAQETFSAKCPGGASASVRASPKEASAPAISVGSSDASAHRPVADSCVHAQERFVKFLRVVKDGRPDLIRGPRDGPAVRIHLVGGVCAERLESVP